MDEACEHGETGICLRCPVLMTEVREPGAGIPAAVVLLAVPLLILLLAVTAR